MNVPKLPRLLDASMRETARLRPTKLDVAPNGDTLSSASMSLPPGEPRVPLRAWVELFTAQGSAGVYRVTSRREDVGSETRLTLKHGLCALEDFVLSGEGELTGDARAILSAILAAQKTVFWKLGSVAGTGSIKVEYSSTNALELLEDALSKLPGFALTFDQTAFPWTLGLAALSADDGAEARLSRNLKSVSIDEDDGELCTRVYIDDRPGYTDGPTIDEYGVIERVLTVPDGATDEEAAGYAAAYLREHQRPVKTVTLDAYDLSRDTGEDLDAFRLWKNARVPLPMLGETLRERVTALSYPDVFGDPQNVRVTVGQKPRDLSSMLDNLRERTTKSERTAADTSKAVTRNSAAIEKNITELHDTYTGLVKLGEQTAAQFNDVQIKLDAQQALIDLKASSTEVSAMGQRLSQAEIAIDGANAKITLKADSTTVDALGKRVSAAEITIDGLNSEIALKADKITLQGYVTASQLQTELAKIKITESSYVTTAGLNTQSLGANYVETNTLKVGGYNAAWKSVSVVTDVTLNRSSLWVVTSVSFENNLSSSRQISYGTSVTCTTETINYLGR